MTVSVKLDQSVVIAEARAFKAKSGKVVKIGRVWIEIQPEGWTGGRTLRFRLDTQTDGSYIGAPPRFYTLDQWAERRRQATADKFLRDQGISINSGSVWRGREFELASLLGLTQPQPTTPGGTT